MDEELDLASDFGDELPTGSSSADDPSTLDALDRTNQPYQRLLVRLEALGCLDGERVRLDEARGSLVRCPAHDDRKASLSIREGGDSRALLNCLAGCPTETVVAALGLRMADLFPGPTVYSYIDLDGEVRRPTVRYTPKAFKQRRPDSKGGWIYNLDGVDLVLFDLLGIQGREEALPEGEKDVETITRMVGRYGAVGTYLVHPAADLGSQP